MAESAAEEENADVGPSAAAAAPDPRAEPGGSSDTAAASGMWDGFGSDESERRLLMVRGLQRTGVGCTNG